MITTATAITRMTAMRLPSLSSLPSGFSSCFSTKTNLLKRPNLQLTDVDGTSKDAEALFANKKVVVFGVPGAFTPLCSNKHVPSFLTNADQLKSRGVDSIICVSVNDRFVMKGWQTSLGDNGNKVEFFADWDGSFLKELDLLVDLSKAGLGVRSKRFSAVVQNGEVIHSFIEESPAKLEVADAETILKHLN